MKNIQIHTDMHKKIRLYCAEHDVTIREVVEAAVEIYISNKNKEG
jgi:hypothetical protein